MSRLWRPLVRQFRDRERGAALIEAALVFPIIIGLVFGMIEYGLVFKDYLTVSNMTRAGARIGSSDGNVQQSDYDILQAVKTASTALQANTLQFVVVFKSNGTTTTPPAACLTGGQGGVCNYYTPSDLNRPKTDFTCASSSGLDGWWCPSTRSVSQGAGADYLGVFVKVNHRMVTKLYGTTKTMNDGVVMRLEPKTS